ARRLGSVAGPAGHRTRPVRRLVPDARGRRLRGPRPGPPGRTGRGSRRRRPGRPVLTRIPHRLDPHRPVAADRTPRWRSRAARPGGGVCVRSPADTERRPADPPPAAAGGAHRAPRGRPAPTAARAAEVPGARTRPEGHPALGATVRRGAGTLAAGPAAGDL